MSEAQLREDRSGTATKRSAEFDERLRSMFAHVGLSRSMSATHQR